MGSNVWFGIMTLVLINVFRALMFTQTVSVLDIVAIGVLVFSLMAYIGLIGSSGSDIFGLGATAVSVGRAAAIVGFVAGLTTLIIADAVQAAGAPSWILAFVNAFLGGYILFEGMAAAKPGGTPE